MSASPLDLAQRQDPKQGDHTSCTGGDRAVVYERLGPGPVRRHMGNNLARPPFPVGGDRPGVAIILGNVAVRCQNIAVTLGATEHGDEG